MDTLARPAEARRAPATLWLLRCVITVHLMAVLGQPVFAGLFLTGDVKAIQVHAMVGSMLAAFDLLVIVAALLHVIGGRGRFWVLPVAVVLFLAVGLQIGMGYARILQVHVPLGVAIVTASVLLAIWVWSPSSRRPRGGVR
ncbi:hypothetical protein [Pseudonocardia sp. GCM10023141]|uniref:hypothetical protein n=1 Tax=Pseudonocardia sp. GCM10023141 TaxID=3252653 RepID=UPI0036087906